MNREVLAGALTVVVLTGALMAIGALVTWSWVPLIAFAIALPIAGVFIAAIGPVGDFFERLLRGRK